MAKRKAGAPDGLERFSAPVREWFAGAFGTPTPVQERAWSAIAEGKNSLVIAPTGSGKTLAAFLFAIDRLARQKAAAAAEGASWPKGVRVLYLSPLKALGADVDRNLQRPLASIVERAAEGGVALPPIGTAQRTGDTTPDERRRIQRNPPDILITTPESLYLMLTSQAREALRTVEAVIVDEVHALAGSKRGAHLALSLERLDDLLGRPAQRIGLSATVRPPEVVARFLGGSQPVEVASAPAAPSLEVAVRVPVEDMTAIPAYGGGEGAPRAPQGPAGGPRRAAAEVAWKSDRALRAAMEQGGAAAPTPESRLGSSSIWPYIEAALLDEVLAHRSTIVFVNSRGLCEKLTARLNELYAKRVGASAPAAVSAGWWSAVGSASGLTSYRSDIGGTSSLVQATDLVVAKAHHGSVSKEKRRAVEEELKRGELPCVVATSSLELGIDMGEVDLVLQVAPPPSVSSGLQRIGRANHQVGGTSQGIVYPRTRPEVIDAAVVAEGMRAGALEATALVENPLDVLAQQTVAAVALGPVAADDWFATVRRAAGFARLPRSAFDAVCDMLAGRMNSGDLAEFSPRILWDRATGMLEPRPSSQRLAVTGSGTIPDRGLFSVVLPEGDGRAGRRRVGELDEEMVMESRVGDVIALGTSTWRITEITGDRVMVEPAPGRSARLPFWHGEAIGRPADLGRARGAFVREVADGLLDAADGEEGGAQVFGPEVRERLARAGLDERAVANLGALLAAQRQATGALPTDRTLVVEQCQDEAGDWRVILHSPYGRRVHEPWALAVAERIRSERGFDPQVMAGDDGIMVRFPLVEEALPGPELFRFDPAEVEAVVRAKVDSTALFAARFRECAARALLMSPTTPGKRAPLWQQRLRAGQLLEAARQEEGFPIMVEAARECLRDVFDLPALRGLMTALAEGTVRLAEARTGAPSPFAAPLIFGYVGEHLYEGDLPHAERRASLLAVDPGLLGELLGGDDVGALLDPAVVREVASALQRTAPGWQARGAEGVADLLRELGPLSAEEVVARLEGEGAPADAEALLRGLEQAHRAFPCVIGGQERWAAADDGPRLAAVLGVAVPAWARGDEAGKAPSERGLDGLVARYGRTHGPFGADALAERLGLGPALVQESLERLAAEGKLEPIAYPLDGDPSARAWVEAGVLRRLRSRSLARARQAVRPVPAAAYARFLLGRQGVGAREGLLEGIEGVAEVIAQFEGVFLTMGQWESVVLPRRVRRYRPAWLDELVATGEVTWVAQRAEAAGLPGRGRRSSAPAEAPWRVAFFPADSPLAPVPVGLAEAPAPAAAFEPGDLQAPAEPSDVGEALARVLAAEGPLAFPQMVEGVQALMGAEAAEPSAVADALARLVAAGRATASSLAFPRMGGPRLRSDAGISLGGGQQPPPARHRARSRRSRSLYAEARREARQTAAARLAQRAAFDGALAGQWSLLEPDQASSTLHAVALVESLLDRYGVVAPDVALLAAVPGGLSTLYPVLRRMEEAGDLVRGMFVEGLGPAQFAARDTVDALRAMAAEGVAPGLGAALADGDAPAAADGAALGTMGDAALAGGAEPARAEVAPSATIPAGASADAPAPGSSGGAEPPAATPSPALSACAVLAADDPASLYGAGLPWPEVAQGAVEGAVADDASLLALRPSRRSGALVVLADGAPALYAAPRLKALVAFTAEPATLGAAIEALTAFATAQAKAAGAAGARTKLLVESVNGAPAIATPTAALLEAAGFVRQPNGLRLYVDPF